MQRECRGVRGIPYNFKISDEVTLRDMGIFKLDSLRRFTYRKKYLIYF
jgi:hypothetical protein